MIFSAKYTPPPKNKQTNKNNNRELAYKDLFSFQVPKMRRENLLLEFQEAKYNIVFHPCQAGVSSFFLKGIRTALGMSRENPAQMFVYSCDGCGD